MLAISHELRSPLTRARLNTELLPETEALRANREALLSDLALMRDLVTDLLESERLATPHASLHREPTDLAALARDVCEAVSLNHPQQAPIEQAFDAPLPRLALDPARIRLLLRNLLDNALRHNPPREPAVRLGLSAEADGGIGITVRDVGSGVDEAALPELAQPFYRPDAARERATGGVGLGLYLCKLVAQAHGGSMRIRNAHPGLEVSVKILRKIAA